MRIVRGLWLALVLAAVPLCASAQSNGCPQGGGIAGNSAVGCVNTVPITSRGSGALAVTASSAAINTINSSGTALPAALSNLIVTNTGNSDAAVCPGGGTCTCPENGPAATNGVTIPAGNGGFQFNLGGEAASIPTAVACSGTDTLQFSGW
jgi:hypothetical protein